MGQKRPDSDKKRARLLCGRQGPSLGRKYPERVSSINGMGYADAAHNI